MVEVHSFDSLVLECGCNRNICTLHMLIVNGIQPPDHNNSALRLRNNTNMNVTADYV